MRRFSFRGWGIVLLPLLLVACAGVGEQAQGVSETEVISPESTPAVTELQPTPTVAATSAATSTPITARTLHLWWPEPLAPVDNEDIADVLSAQISGFQNANPDVVVDLRLKAVAGMGGQEVGSLMSMLRAAAAVAPAALPDLTLIRRSDLLDAVQLGLIQPLRVSSAISSDLHPVVATMGQVDTVNYGLAYTLDIEHLVIAENVEPLSRWRFQDVLDAGFAYVFPAGRTNTLSDAFLIQYLNGGHDLTVGQDLLLDGELAIDASVLRAVYEFYEQAVEAGIIDPIVLEYIMPSDYATSIAEGEVSAGVMTSTLYLTLLAEGAALSYGLIPTEAGEAATVVDGWMWVITTSDSGQQEAAMRFLNWMMNVERQEQYASTVHMLPSQRTALRAWDDNAYATFADGLLNHATLPLSDIGGGTPARVMQSALAMVISGQRTAEQATREVIAQLSG